ncbi:MAG: 4-alpha-glucanotransferase [Chloroflexi bacterium]|nr:4-alpha-glucanotransferase [Chloroflexota bacterium]
MSSEKDQLRTLSRLHGVKTSYFDMKGERRRASPEALLAVLRSLGVPVESLRDVPAAIRERRQALWRRNIEPVIVTWDRRPIELELRRPATSSRRHTKCHLKTQEGETLRWTFDLGRASHIADETVEGQRYELHRIIVPFTLPYGYHRLRLEVDGSETESLIISSPLKAYAPRENQTGKVWGVFLPLYALRSRWGVGDFSELGRLMEWVASLGGSFVGTLPLLANFLDEPFISSPYSPASRCFWNELYVDVTRVPELTGCPGTIIGSAEIQQELEELRAAPLVDYRRQMAVKRRTLEELSRCFLAEKPDSYAAFRSFLETHPAVEDYARFRAAGERRRAAWPSWPEPLCDGVLGPQDYDEEACRYHEFVQWLADTQLGDVACTAEGLGSRLYLDLPLGVPTDSYDVWRERSAFAQGVSSGAPPDNFFTKGQDWGLLPLHPEKIREQGYGYFASCIRHHLKYAGALRIDHVMGLHRLFWVPSGMEAKEGVYVRYHAHELYAILILESHRSRSVIVGENLGTVPPAVNRDMARHNILGMYVGQFAFAPNPEEALRAPHPSSMASLNTHDTPTFAGFWHGLDIDYRVSKGLLDENGAQNERSYRQHLKNVLTDFLGRRVWLKGDWGDLLTLLRGCLNFLSAGPARTLMVNLEDLWLETNQQNVPGSTDENPNWRSKARYDFDTFCHMPEVTDILREIDHLRRGKEYPQ